MSNTVRQHWIKISWNPATLLGVCRRDWLHGVCCVVDFIRVHLSSLSGMRILSAYWRTTSNSAVQTEPPGNQSSGLTSLAGSNQKIFMWTSSRECEIQKEADLWIVLNLENSGHSHSPVSPVYIVEQDNLDLKPEVRWSSSQPQAEMCLYVLTEATKGQGGSLSWGLVLLYRSL